ncbi:hypothetical protein J1614_007052 [Plenodomus biglobosus]|nr:hypothetical protein J1614_007052 [Plenodomus biglobosus]
MVGRGVACGHFYILRSIIHQDDLQPVARNMPFWLGNPLSIRPLPPIIAFIHVVLTETSDTMLILVVANGTKFPLTLSSIHCSLGHFLPIIAAVMELPDVHTEIKVR